MTAATQTAHNGVSVAQIMVGRQGVVKGLGRGAVPGPKASSSMLEVGPDSVPLAVKPTPSFEGALDA